MTASHRNFTAAFLRRAGLLVGLLAVMAGIFGMHVMTGTHSMHSPAAVPATTPEIHAGSAATDGHAVHQASGTSGAHPAAELRVAADINDTAGTTAQMCSCPDSGTGMHAMSASCTPSVKTGSLSAPLPGTTVFGIISHARAAGTVPRHYCHLPDGPSPGELSISRT
ncbi:hypothetical protein [Pseudarthrobacter sp. H2]|uniref:hypothetical protein n=1 Tax=Pseudarthrobacter sp. H2 TaxID=3418415 RepID=UPI003CF526C2